MTLPNIALAGAAGAGKSTVAKILFEEYGYTRLSFADQLRSLAMLCPGWALAVEEHGGYQAAKENDPFIREYLVALGEGIRAGDENYFVTSLVNKLDSGKQPFVIDDLRYPNETAFLHSAGFHFIEVHRLVAGANTYQWRSEDVPNQNVYQLHNNDSEWELERRIWDLMDVVNWVSA